VAPTQDRHVAAKTEIVLRGEPCAITIFRDSHGRRERGRLTGLFQGRAKGLKIVDINNFLNITP